MNGAACSVGRRPRSLKEGNRGPAAYRQLLDEITPYLRSLASQRRMEASEIEDAVQDILLTVHAIRNTYDPARPFGPWLAAIAHRRIIDRLPRSTRRKLRETPLTPEHETLAAPQANLPEARSDGRALRNAVESLSPGQRQTVRLLKLESGMPVVLLHGGYGAWTTPDEALGTASSSQCRRHGKPAHFLFQPTPHVRLGSY